MKSQTGGEDEFSPESDEEVTRGDAAIILHLLRHVLHCPFSQVKCSYRTQGYQEFIHKHCIGGVCKSNTMHGEGYYLCPRTGPLKLILAYFCFNSGPLATSGLLRQPGGSVLHPKFAGFGPGWAKLFFSCNCVRFGPSWGVIREERGRAALPQMLQAAVD